MYELSMLMTQLYIMNEAALIAPCTSDLSHILDLKYLRTGQPLKLFRPTARALKSSCCTVLSSLF